MPDLPPATDLVMHSDQPGPDPSASSTSGAPMETTVKSGDVEQLTGIYPSARGEQHLLLDELNDDALAIIVDFLFDMDKLNGQYFYLYDNPGPYLHTHRSTLNLSVVNKRLRSACIRRLFRDIHRCSSSMGQLNMQLKDIELHPDLLSSVRTCEIVTSSRHDSTLCKTRLPKVLATMPHLSELSITHRKSVDFSALEVTFSKADVVLPTVTGLRIQCPGDWDFLVKACPNTEVLILWDNLCCEDLMDSVKALKKLRHLELYSKCWSEDDIERLYDWVPYIESLALKGGLGGRVEKWADTFGQFSRLRTLAVTTDPIQLDCRFEYAFSDDSEAAMSLINSRRSHGVHINFDEMAFDYFTSIRTLDFLYLWEFGGGTSLFTVARNKDGNPASVYPNVEDDEYEWGKFYETLDSDGFPKKLSFPHKILSSDAKCDPPTFGRSTPADREEQKAREEEKNWYTKHWARWQSIE